MKTVLLHCKPNTRFHFGKVGIDPDASLNDTSHYLHSDTLYSAIINIAAMLYDDKSDEFKNILNAFEKDDIKLSSAFYCINTEGGKIYFLPKPCHWQRAVKDNFKVYNAIKFISKGIWEQGVHPERWEAETIVLQNQFRVLKSELTDLILLSINQFKFFKVDTQPKVFVSKPTQEDSLYFLNSVVIADNRSFTTALKPLLYFLIDAPDEDFYQSDVYLHILACIRMLPTEGVGGERSSGCGLFESISFDEDFSLISDSSLQATLSLYNPKEKDEMNAWNAWQTIQRGGRRTYEHGNLKYVNMLREGSVFNSTVEGNIVDISSEKGKGIYKRYGKAFCVPVTQI